jgi:toxin FitB
MVQGSYVSIITRLEILGWQGHTPHSRDQTKELFSYFIEIPLNEAIANLCIRLRATQRLKLPEAVIAATALYLGLPLMTANVSDFKGIFGLQVINPFEGEVFH